MQTLRDIAPYVALAAAALALVLLVVVIVLLARVSRLRKAQTVVMGHEERDVVTHVVNLDSQVRNLREAVELLTDELDRQKTQLNHALTNRSIVRYDAFRDAGGEQSASFALLDEYRSGVVFSAIAARDFARIYVKHLRDGVADRDLSPEEEQAVAGAVPRPLRSGDEGPRAARAPKAPEPEPLRARDAGDDRAARDSGEPRDAGDDAFLEHAGGPAPADDEWREAAQTRPAPAPPEPAGERPARRPAHDTAEFPAPAGAEPRPAGPAGPVDDAGEFTWEPAPDRRPGARPEDDAGA